MNPARARRAKNVSEKLRVVSEGDKREVAKARLDALENDDALPAEDQAAGSDEEFQVEESDEEGGAVLPNCWRINCITISLPPFQALCLSFRLNCNDIGSSLFSSWQ